ncbi:MAG: YdcF family protein [Lentisphaerae bacterium]|nr:YdcF family protein [Lentisphaerota bacterium]
MLTPETITLAQQLWDYHHVGHTVDPADCILVLGSHDLRVAERGAELFLAGLAPWLVMSGGLGNLTLGVWTEPEADRFARVACELGVPPGRILIENRSTNTGENIAYSRDLLRARGLDPQSFLVVQKPYMERRAFATFKQRWPEKDIRVTSPQIAFADYPTPDISMEDVIHIMVGDLQRIIEYPSKGFQIAQDVPPAIHAAFAELVRRGYTRHLINT